MKVLSFILNSAFLLIMLGVAGLFVLPYLPIEQSIDLRIVESGSMEPAIMTGALIAVRPADSYGPGDVIMFESRYAKVPTTHRVLETYEENGRTWFVTKGDANEEADAEAIPENNVLGAVLFDVPRAGFVLDFARQPLGFAFLIVLPAVLIIMSELEKIWREVRRRRQGSTGYRVPSRERQARDRKRPVTPAPVKTAVPAVVAPPLRHTTPKQPIRRTVATRPQMMDIATPAQRFEWPTLDLRGVTPYQPTRRRLFTVPRVTAVVSVVVFSVLVWSAGVLGTTVSYFNDLETTIDNLFAAIMLDVTAVPDGEQFNFIGEELDDDDGELVVFVTPETDSVAVRYEVMVEETGGPAAFCAALTAESNLPVPYSGPLLGLSGSDITFDIPWSIQFALPDDSGLGSNELCTADIVLTAWYEETNTDEGYYDEERVPLVFNYTDPTPAPVAPLALPQTNSFSLEVITTETTDEVEPEPIEPTEDKEAESESTGPEEDDEPDAEEESEDDGREVETDTAESENTNESEEPDPPVVDEDTPAAETET